MGKDDKTMDDLLAPYAIKNSESKGRIHAEKSDDNRLPFQRDKDRIIHCKAFRRLDSKTQVFIAGSGDHYRTRLTHTLEVAQVARDIARRMKLNEDLCEAIALAHDLGHPPFGHGGEETLDKLMIGHGLRFEHNEQSRRVVEVLEKAYPGFDGLNLSYEVLDGLIKHKTSWDQAGKDVGEASVEARVVNVADEIAYTNHDIDDGLRSGLISLEELEKFELWKIAGEKVYMKFGRDIGEQVFISRMIAMIMSLMIEDFCAQGHEVCDFSSDMKHMIVELREHLFENFYTNSEVMKFVKKGQDMITKLFKYYLDKWGKDRIVDVKDYLAGMTDNYLMEEYKKFC